MGAGWAPAGYDDDGEPLGARVGAAVAASCGEPLLAGDGAVTEVALSLAVASVRTQRG